MNDLVVKSNDLNELPIYKKSLELKLFAKIIALVREDPNQDIFTFQVKDFMKEFTGSTENYQYIKKAAKNMMIAERVESRKIILEVIFRRIDIAESGTISFKIDPEFKPLVVNLSKNFTQYYLQNIAKLKSAFSIRIYEILKQWETIGNKKFSISAIRFLLKIDDKKYKLYGHFKSKVLLVAQKELEEKTDIKFDFEEIKTGRRITDIHFFIKPNHQNKVVIKTKPTKKTQQEPIDKEIKELFEELKISQDIQQEIIKNYEKKLLKENLLYTIRELEKGNIATSSIQYLRSALKRDYANQPTLFNSKDYRKEKQQVEDIKTKKLEQKKADFQQKRDEKIFDYIEKNKEKLGALFPDFIEKNKFHFDKFYIKEEDFEEQKIRELINTDRQTKILFKSFIMKTIMTKKEYDFDEFIKIQKV